VDSDDDSRFAQLTAMACHDLRTPLATVYGFSRTLARIELGEPADHYVEMIEAASSQVGDLLEQLTLVAQIERGRFDPQLDEVDSLALARSAAGALGEDRVAVSGDGATVRVPLRETERALTQLARAAQRHGGLEAVELEVQGPELSLGPVNRNSEGVVLGTEIRELGAAAGAALVRALGGSLEPDGDRVRIRLPG
jgi:signal transduction histidine kinase